MAAEGQRQAAAPGRRAELVSGPRGANRGDWRACNVYDTLAGSEQALSKLQNACRQDELGIVGIFLWYRIGSAPCPFVAVHH